MTDSSGLDQLLRDINSDDGDVRKLSMKLVASLMANDDLICVKFCKIKLVSNLLKKYAVRDEDGMAGSEEDNESVNSILKALLNCKHREALFTQSKQFQVEKERLYDVYDTAKKVKVDAIGGMHPKTLQLMG